jgi:hypothetical protein
MRLENRNERAPAREIAGVFQRSILLLKVAMKVNCSKSQEKVTTTTNRTILKIISDCIESECQGSNRLQPQNQLIVLGARYLTLAGFGRAAAFLRNFKSGQRLP